MSQNPTKSTLLVTKIIAGPGVTVTPDEGTGIVTVSADGLQNLQSGTGITVTVGTSSTVQISTLPSTILVDAFAAALATVAVNGTTPVSVTDTGVTASSVIIFTLKTPGGTVGPNPPNVKTITPGTGFTVEATASDTSTYNYVRIG